MPAQDIKSPGTGGKRILIGEGLFSEPGVTQGASRLIGSKCDVCGEVVFPRQICCPNCCSENVTEVQLSSRGKLYSFTNVNNPVPEGYKGVIPYGIGLVELPEGVRILSYLTESDPGKLKADMDMELIVEKLFVDEQGNEVIGFKFKPV